MTRKANPGGASADPGAHPAPPLFATLRFSADAEHVARIRDLQPASMMIDAIDSLSVTDAIEIALPGIGAIDGRIAWRAGKRMGVRLDRMIDPERVRPIPARSRADYVKALRVASRDAPEP